MGKSDEKKPGGLMTWYHEYEPEKKPKACRGCKRTKKEKNNGEQRCNKNEKDCTVAKDDKAVKK